MKIRATINTNFATRNKTVITQNVKLHSKDKNFTSALQHIWIANKYPKYKILGKNLEPVAICDCLNCYNTLARLISKLILYSAEAICCSKQALSTSETKYPA